MAKDYAKKRKTPAKAKKTPARRKSASKSTSRSGGVRIYFAGLLSGLFISFLAYLATNNFVFIPRTRLVAERCGREA